MFYFKKSILDEYIPLANKELDNKCKWLSYFTFHESKNNKSSYYLTKLTFQRCTFYLRQTDYYYTSQFISISSDIYHHFLLDRMPFFLVFIAFCIHKPRL